MEVRWESIHAVAVVADKLDWCLFRITDLEHHMIWVLVLLFALLAEVVISTLGAFEADTDHILVTAITDDPLVHRSLLVDKTRQASINKSLDLFFRLSNLLVETMHAEEASLLTKAAVFPVRLDFIALALGASNVLFIITACIWTRRDRFLRLRVNLDRLLIDRRHLQVLNS